MAQLDYDQLAATREALRARYLQPERDASAARGIHHAALLCADVERTVKFYSEVLELPLTDMIENRDHHGSTRFYFDAGNGNLLAFFDLPGVDLGEYAEVLGGLHHLAISVEPAHWSQLKANLDAAGVPYQLEGGTSVHFRDPDGARLELIADPLGEVYGTKIL